MNRPLIQAALVILVAALVLAHLAPAFAKDAGAGKAVVAVQIVKCEKGITNSPTSDLYDITLRVTNQGTRVVQFTNNSFVLEDSAGVRHRVARRWYRQTLALQPGESSTVDRLYFEIPKTTKPRSIGLVEGRHVMGRASL